jgi:hypothetical protein
LPGGGGGGWLQTDTKRISNGYQTDKAAEIRHANASNGFDFALLAGAARRAVGWADFCWFWLAER